MPGVVEAEDIRVATPLKDQPVAEQLQRDEIGDGGQILGGGGSGGGRLWADRAGGISGVETAIGRLSERKAQGRPFVLLDWLIITHIITLKGVKGLTLGERFFRRSAPSE